MSNAQTVEEMMAWIGRHSMCVSLRLSPSWKEWVASAELWPVDGKFDYANGSHGAATAIEAVAGLMKWVQDCVDGSWLAKSTAAEKARAQAAGGEAS